MWKDIPNYEGHYQVNDIGEVRSLKTNKILKQSLSSSYWGVTLCKDGIPKGKRVHQLMAMAFLGHNPNGYSFVVDHIDNNKLNNNLKNIQVVSHRQNISNGKKKNNYTGVCWHKRKNKYISSIMINGKLKHLGYFENEYDAHLAYENKLREYAQM